MKKIQLVIVRNPFDRSERDVRFISVHSRMGLAGFVQRYVPAPPEGTELVYSINGRIAETLKKTKLCDGDCIVVVPKVAGGGDDSKNPLALLAGLALAALSFGVSTLFTGGSAWLGTIAAGAVMMVGGSLINSWFSADVPDTQMSDRDKETSYQWGSLQSVVGQGGALPLTYGTVRTAGTLIAQHITHSQNSDGTSDSYLNLLYTGGLGPVDEIGDIELNDTPVGNYNDVLVQTRLGENNQAVLTNFNEIYVDQFPQLALGYETPGVTTIAVSTELPYTAGQAAQYINRTLYCREHDRVDLEITFPLGLTYYYWDESKGDRGTWVSRASWVGLSIQYRKDGGAWQDIYSGTYVAETVRTQSFSIKWSLSLEPTAGFSAGNYEFRAAVTNKEGTDFNTQEQYLNRTIFSSLIQTSNAYQWATTATDGNAGNAVILSLSFAQGLFYSGDSGEAESTWVNFRIEYQKEGADRWTTWHANLHIEGKIEKAFVRSYRLAINDDGRYLFRVAVTGKAGTTLRYINTVTFHQLTHTLTETLGRPGKVLVGISIKASDQLSGSSPRVTWVQRRNNIFVYENGIWMAKPANNPAWICYDMAVQARVIEGTIQAFGDKPSRIDLDAFKGWAAWNERTLNNRPALQMNILVDEASDLWDWWNRIGLSSRGRVILKGTKISCVWDQPKDPVQLFTMGNIEIDSLSGEFCSSSDRANAVEISFVDEDKKYERRQITVYSDSYNEVEQIANTTSVFLYGITNYERAWREGHFRLLCNRYIRRTINFTADVDALACELGDVINVAHDVPMWGQSGRTLPGSTDSVLVLDREVVMVTGLTYAIMVRLVDVAGNEQIVTRSIINSGAASVITLETSLPQMPQDFAVYSVGQTEILVKPFRVQGISRADDLKVSIKAVEYIPAVYTEASDIPEIDYTDLATFALMGLSLTETTATKQNGTVYAYLTAYWEWTGERPQRFSVQWSENGGEWKNSQATASNTTQYDDPAYGNTYRFRVRAYNEFGIAGSWYYSDIIMSAIDLSTLPPDVTGFRAVQDGEYVDLMWDKVRDSKFSHYEVRSGATWATAQVIAERVVNNYYDVPVAFERKYMYLAKALNTYGQSSQNAAVASIIVRDLPVKNVVVTWDEFNVRWNDLADGLTWGDTPDDLTWEGITNGTNDDTMFIINPLTWLSLADDLTFDMLDDNFTWQDFGGEYVLTLVDGVTYGIWTSEVKDIGRVLSAKLFPDMYAYLGDGATAILEMRTSLDNDVWSDWAPFLPHTSYFRYLQYRVVLQTEDAANRPLVTRLVVIADVPDVIRSGRAEVPAGGLTISYGYEYTVTPAVVITADGGDRQARLAGPPGTTEFTVDVLDSSLASVGGEINWTARGY